MREIDGFEAFVTDLKEAGMSLGGENGEGIFTLCDYFTEQIRWHTEDPATDPWEWRMRVLRETEDIAYGKFFFKKSGFITKEWYPYFYKVRRRGVEFEEAYEEGTASYIAKTIYGLLKEQKELPLHLIKQYGGFQKEDKARFDAAITELQMKFYITMCGRSRKQSKRGEEYGWSSTVFCLTEDYVGEEIMKKADDLTYEYAYEMLMKQVKTLNPQVLEKKAKKFILG